MSGEFGSYGTGYFDDLIRLCADDATGAGFAITRRWGEVLEAFVPIARALAYAEASDSSEADAILESIKCIGQVKLALQQVQEYLYPAQQGIRPAKSGQSNTGGSGDRELGQSNSTDPPAWAGNVAHRSILPAAG